jgi:predicted DNA-binding antitoxin AbrB/MazE fold protein
MGLEIEAIYEHGTLKLSRELPLQEGQKVRIMIQAHGGAASRLAGLIPWTGGKEELVRYLDDPDEGVLGHHEL